MHAAHSGLPTQATLSHCCVELWQPVCTQRVFSCCLQNYAALELFTAVNVPELEEGAKAMVKEVKALPKEVKEHGGRQRCCSTTAALPC